MPRKSAKRKTAKKFFSPKEEGLIAQLLDEAVDLIDLISIRMGEKEFPYLRDALFLVLRQIGHFIIEQPLPSFPQKSILTIQEESILNRIRDIRDAIGHRQSPINFLNAHLKISGAMIFQQGDMEIQFGKTRIFLIREVLSIHRRLRGLLSTSEELGFLSGHPRWAFEEQRLSRAETLLKKKLADPRALMQLK